MSDEVRVTPLAIGGLGITYQITIGDGRTIAFEASIDATVDRADLDELLDRVGDAAERRQAVFELPLTKAGLLSNRELLKQQMLARRKAEADFSARMDTRGRGGRTVEPKPADLNALAQFDERIAKIQAQIKTAEVRIPYLQAIIDRTDPPDLFPELQENYREAAE